LEEWRPAHSAVPNPDLLAPRRGGRWRWAAATLGLAAAAAVAVGLWWQPARPANDDAVATSAPLPVPAERATAVALAAGEVERRVLADGSVAELNRGAALEERFSAGERRVVLAAGEVHFTVVKDTERPFVVAAHGVDLRAVGTAFNVRLESSGVEVLVTEGRVAVAGGQTETRPASGERAAEVPVLRAGERAVVALGPTAKPIQIAQLTAREIERVLSWQHRLLEFNETALGEVVAEFNRRNRLQLVLSDPKLAAERITVSFRTDNVEGFVRLLEAGFGVRVERPAPGEIVLRKQR
jgi:transmembrane sensor